MNALKIKTKWIWWMGMMLFLPLMGGCQKEENNNCNTTAVEGSINNIVGRWKLIKGETFSGSTQQLQTEDYSCANLIYLFRNDGTLTISSNIPDYIGHVPGQYPYEFSAQVFNEGEDLGYSLKIDNVPYAMNMSTGDMVIHLNPVDPLALYESRLTSYFIRVQ